MARNIIVNGANGFASSSLSASTVNYLLAANRQVSNSTVDDLSLTWDKKFTGYFSSMAIQVTSNAASGGTSTMVFYKNQIVGNGAVSIAASTTGIFRDSSNAQDSVAPGDTWGYRLTVNSGGSLGYSAYWATLVAATDTVALFGFITHSTTTASTNFFFGLGGNSSGNTTEASAQTSFLKAGTIKNLTCSVTTNARASATTVTSRKNTANGNLSVSVTASTTGLFSDTTNSDTIAVNDLWCVQVANGTGTAAISLRMSVQYSNTANQSIQGGKSESAIIQGANIVRYYGFNAIGGAQTTESQVQIAVYYSGILSNATVNITSNTVTAASTMVTRINGVSGTVSVSITASTTGRFTDTSHTDAVKSGDLLNFMLTTGVTGTSLNINEATIYLQAIDAVVNDSVTITENVSLVVNSGPTLSVFPSSLRTVKIVDF